MWRVNNMRLQDGRFIKYTSHNDATQYVYITDGQDVRLTDTKNGSHCSNRLLRKFEFISQDEMHHFVRANQPKVSTDELAESLEDKWNKEHPKKLKGFFRIITIRNSSSWAFGHDDESNTSRKTDKLLEDGRSTESVKRTIRKTLKDVRLAGVDKMLNERFESVKRKRVWCEDGSELDIDRIMTGDPDHWIKTKRNGKKRVIRIGVNVSMSSFNSSEVFAKNVALAYICAEGLENLGYGVEIVAVNSSYFLGSQNHLGQDETATTFPLKRVTEPVDIERVGSIGLSSMLRYYGFTTDTFINRQPNGMPNTMSNEMKGFMNIDILVETSWSSGDSHKQARKISRVIDKTINN